MGFLSELFKFTASAAATSLYNTGNTAEKYRHQHYHSKKVICVLKSPI